MASRKTQPEPFPVRGTPSGYRDRWEADDEAIIQAQRAEREQLSVAVRESAARYRRGKSHGPEEAGPLASPGDRTEADP